MLSWVAVILSNDFSAILSRIHDNNIFHTIIGIITSMFKKRGEFSDRKRVKSAAIRKMLMVIFKVGQAFFRMKGDIIFARQP